MRYNTVNRKVREEKKYIFMILMIMMNAAFAYKLQSSFSFH